MSAARVIHGTPHDGTPHDRSSRPAASTTVVDQVTGSGPPPVLVPLDDGLAHDASLVGAKAANLSRLAALGLPVLPGVVITTAGSAGGRRTDAATAALDQWWAAHPEVAGSPVVVRSSSTIEDAVTSSMAGRFTSVLDVCGWDSLCRAVDTVLASAGHVDEPAPMAVLVQRQLSAATGGVLFGADPVRGRVDRIVVEWVSGRPDVLVSGVALAAHAELTPRGRLVTETLPVPPSPSSTTPSAPAGPPPTPLLPAPPRLSRSIRRRLAATARVTAAAFGAPQDIEWAIDLDGGFWLLQTRPVTALHRITSDRHHVRLGTGPVAETFPNPLSALEVDLWVTPLREGIVRALRATGAVSEHVLRRSPVVTTVDGWVAIDLDLIAGTDERRTWRQLVSPRAILRHLRTAWRVGRLRVALPTLATMVVQSVDEHLGTIGPIGASPDVDLLALLDRSRDELATVHSYEVLAGMLLSTAEATPMAMVAFRALHDSRRLGMLDDELVMSRPEVLTLSAPRIAIPSTLPARTALLPALAPEGTTIDDVSFRDALRLRARWLHELQCRVARELGHRAAMRGAIADTADVSLLTFDELRVLHDRGSMPDDLDSRRRSVVPRRLPSEFVRAVDGTVVPISNEVTRHRHLRHGGSRSSDGIAAGGGRGEGVVIDRAGARALVAGGHPVADLRQHVLVTEHLDPDLAPVLPVLAGLVAETGSALSHLAILAREVGVPAVVAVDDACRRFPVGAAVAVDGIAGTVTLRPDGPVDQHSDGDRHDSEPVGHGTPPRGER